MNRQQNGRMNVFQTLAGAYLAYLGCNLLYGVWKNGPESTNLWIVLPAAALFLAVGGWLLWREWKAYKYAAAHKDDPASWNDELAEEAAHAEQTDEPPVLTEHSGEDRS